MEFFAMVGALNLMLAAVIVVVLPVALAIWIAPIWLCLYGVYFLVMLLFACVVAGSDTEKTQARPGERTGDE